MRRACVLAVLVAMVGTAAYPQSPDEPTTYREDHYRAPVPETLRGVTVVDDATAHALWTTGRVVFIDVLPQPPKPELPEGTIFRRPPRISIPGSTWLPNTGYGRLAERVDAYFQSNLKRLTNGDQNAPLLFFCLADCWMSWNAAKRAREEYGYHTVFWYPEGSVGWDFADYPMEKIDKVPLKPDDDS